MELEGVEFQHLPLLRTQCVPFVAPDFDIAVFYSKNGVLCAHQNGLNLSEATVWAVGDSTASQLRCAFPGIEPRVPSEQTFEGLVKALEPTLGAEARVLSIGLEDGPRSLEARLNNTVREVVAYRTVRVEDPSLTDPLESADAVVFASPRAVRAFAALSDQRSQLVGSIGPTTTASLNANGFPQGSIVEIEPPNLSALLTRVAHQLLDD